MRKLIVSSAVAIVCATFGATSAYAQTATPPIACASLTPTATLWEIPTVIFATPTAGLGTPIPGGTGVPTATVTATMTASPTPTIPPTPMPIFELSSCGAGNYCDPGGETVTVSIHMHDVGGGTYAVAAGYRIKTPIDKLYWHYAVNLWGRTINPYPGEDNYISVWALPFVGATHYGETGQILTDFNRYMTGDGWVAWNGTINPTVAFGSWAKASIGQKLVDYDGTWTFSAQPIVVETPTPTATIEPCGGGAIVETACTDEFCFAVGDVIIDPAGCHQIVPVMSFDLRWASNFIRKYWADVPDFVWDTDGLRVCVYEQPMTIRAFGLDGMVIMVYIARMFYLFSTMTLLFRR